MKIIPLIGILHFFGPLIFYKSKRAMLIFINGLIFHTLDVSDINNQINTPFVNFLKYYDTFSNIIMISYTVYYYKQIHFLAFIACYLYLIEVYCVKYTNLEYYHTDIIHLIMHGIFGYCLSLTLKN